MRRNLRDQGAAKSKYDGLCIVCGAVILWGNYSCRYQVHVARAATCQKSTGGVLAPYYFSSTCLIFPSCSCALFFDFSFHAFSYSTVLIGSMSAICSHSKCSNASFNSCPHCCLFSSFLLALVCLFTRLLFVIVFDLLTKFVRIHHNIGQRGRWNRCSRHTSRQGPKDISTCRLFVGYIAVLCV